MSFIISGHRSKFRSLSFKDVKSAITINIDSFSMYFTLAVYEKHIYGVISSEKANTVEVFIYFLSELIECQNKFFKEDLGKTYFVMDNASFIKLLM